MHDATTKANLDDTETYEALLPLVRSLVSSKFRVPTHVAEPDELVQVGVLGALEAADRWDPSKGTKFTSFVHFRAHGAIQDYLRKQQPGTRRDPNRFQILSLDVPLHDSISDKGGAAVGTVKDRLTAQPDDSSPEGDPFLRQALAEALSSISEDARMAVFLAYADETKWTRRDIGEQIDRTEAATYQLIHHSLKKLRAHPSLRDYAPAA